jgi:uncharacterized membrane protein YesL
MMSRRNHPRGAPPQRIYDQRQITVGETVERWPGATAKFALFAEVLFVGVLCVGAGLLIITLPAAMVASSRHLHRFLLAEKSTMGYWWADFRIALRTGWVVGLVAATLSAILLLNIMIASRQALPGWQFILAFGTVMLVGLVMTLLQSTVRWRPDRGWKQTLQRGHRSFVEDPGSVPLLLVALLLTVVLAWQLPPLIVPGIGCLVFAALATSVRKRRGRS